MNPILARAVTVNRPGPSPMTTLDGNCSSSSTRAALPFLHRHPQLFQHSTDSKHTHYNNHNTSHIHHQTPCVVGSPTLATSLNYSKTSCSVRLIPSSNRVSRASVKYDQPEPNRILPKPSRRTLSSPRSHFVRPFQRDHLRDQAIPRPLLRQ